MVGVGSAGALGLVGGVVAAAKVHWWWRCCLVLHRVGWGHGLAFWGWVRHSQPAETTDAALRQGTALPLKHEVGGTWA